MEKFILTTSFILSLKFKFITPSILIERDNILLLLPPFIVVIIAILGLIVIYKRLNSIKNGEPTTDELSRLILQKSSSISFYVSLYLWLVIGYLNDRINVDSSQLISYGIIGMAAIFVILLVILKIRTFKSL